MGHVAGQHSNARLDRMTTRDRADEARVDLRDYYAGLGAEPSASVARLGVSLPARGLAVHSAQRAWIVANHIDGQDWRGHRERYWLGFAAAYYRDRGRTDDWLGAL